VQCSLVLARICDNSIGCIMQIVNSRLNDPIIRHASLVGIGIEQNTNKAQYGRTEKLGGISLGPSFLYREYPHSGSLSPFLRFFWDYPFFYHYSCHKRPCVAAIDLSEALTFALVTPLTILGYSWDIMLKPYIICKNWVDKIIVRLN
jgi:hypothetical protein